MNYDILGDMGFSFLKDPSEKINTLIPDYSEVEYDSATGSYKCSKEEPFDGSPEFPYLTGTANYNYTTEFKDDKLYKIKNKHNVFLKSNLDSIEQNVFIEGNVDFSYEQKPVEIPEEIRQKMV